jgi:hypothetical protein
MAKLVDSQEGIEVRRRVWLEIMDVLKGVAPEVAGLVS